ncbi:MAG TPA: type II toxin-antitoxin system VapC family toxin [Gemmatimonadales bacterium]|nr:type II toxin-antitoxin system VapC family toxin [Gemmatimonadales bacterium]
MKRLLLDTEVLIWWDMNDARLGGHARALIQDAVEILVSAASAWEIANLVALGKLTTTRSVSTALQENGFGELPVTVEQIETAASLPPHHADPIDRLIIAAAIGEGLAVVTADRRFDQYSVMTVDASS